MPTTVMLFSYRVQNTSAQFYTCLCYSYRRQRGKLKNILFVFCHFILCFNSNLITDAALIRQVSEQELTFQLCSSLRFLLTDPYGYVGYFSVCAMTNFFDKCLNTCLQHAEAKVYDKASQQLFSLINMDICGLNNF